MKIELQSTTRIVQVNGFPGRVWEGKTDGGIECFAVVTRIACHAESDSGEFDRELQEGNNTLNSPQVKLICANADVSRMTKSTGF